MSNNHLNGIVALVNGLREELDEEVRVALRLLDIEELEMELLEEVLKSRLSNAIQAWDKGRVGAQVELEINNAVEWMS